MAFYLLSPANQVSLYAGVSATVDSTYDDDWICDGRPLRPIRGTGTSFSATITPAAAGTVNFLAVSHSNLSVGCVFSGGVSGTVAAGALDTDGTRLNTFLAITSVPAVSSVSIAVTSSSATVMIGEVYFGNATTIGGPFYRDSAFEDHDHARVPDNDLSDVPGYDDGNEGGRSFSGTWPVLSATDRDVLRACFKAQHNRTRPTLLVPDSSVNDVLVGYITKLSYKPSDVPNKWEVSLTFQEIPRVRW